MTRCYQWNEDKNTWLKQHRNISFEEIILAIQSGQEVNVFEHPNQIRYPGQKISVVIVNNYGYLVPSVESEKAIFLKTIIPSRKATKQYLRNSDE